MHPNFFSGTNMINLFKNVSIRFITTGFTLAKFRWKRHA